MRSEGPASSQILQNIRAQAIVQVSNRGWRLQHTHFLYVAECLDKLKPVMFD